MGFRQADSKGRGGYAKIWEYHDVTNGLTVKKNDGTENVLSPGNYSLVKLSTWKKKGERYETDFQDGFVKLVGAAHTKAKELDFENKSFEKGVSIQITSCDVTTVYDATTKRGYTNYVVFAFNIPEINSNYTQNKKPAAKTSQYKPVADNEDLPF